MTRCIELRRFKVFMSSMRRSMYVDPVVKRTTPSICFSLFNVRGSNMFYRLAATLIIGCRITDTRRTLIRWRQILKACATDSRPATQKGPIGQLQMSYVLLALCIMTWMKPVFLSHSETHLDQNGRRVDLDVLNMVLDPVRISVPIAQPIWLFYLHGLFT